MQLFHMVYHRKKGFQAKICMLLMLHCLKFHVTNTLLCLHAFGNMGGG